MNSITSINSINSKNFNKPNKPNKPKRGFTFIEILITLAVIAICFLPLMRMFSTSLEQAYILDDLSTARYLAQEGMEKIKNLNFTETQLKNLGDVWEPPLASSPLLLNKKRWRVLRKVIKNSNPLEVHIQVYQEQFASEVPARNKTSIVEKKPIVELVTLIEDLE